MVAGPIISEKRCPHIPGPKLHHSRMGRMEGRIPVTYSWGLTLSICSANQSVGLTGLHKNTLLNRAKANGRSSTGILIPIPMEMLGYSF